MQPALCKYLRRVSTQSCVFACWLVGLLALVHVKYTFPAAPLVAPVMTASPDGSVSRAALRVVVHGHHNPVHPKQQEPAQVRHAI
jgi:hypothetical protein